MIKKCKDYLYQRREVVFLLAAARAITNKIKEQGTGIKDRYICSWKNYPAAKKEMEEILLSEEELDFSGFDVGKAEFLWKMYSSHRFDLLGSGWIRCGFQSQERGMEGYSYENSSLYIEEPKVLLKELVSNVNYKQSARIFSMIDKNYVPIDWQRDHKSGYRWGAGNWYRPVKIADVPGGDIKWPWELSRLQHLPRLAILYKILGDKKSDIYKEFRNELLDFIAQNPVRFGVNHMCTMDVGIRVANISVACMLFRGMNVFFDKKFENILLNYLFQECEFIRKNLEWSYYLTSNHYFADVAGLLWGSAILPDCRKKRRWIKFAAKEIENEILKQFHPEGSNKEGSVAYHRLTGEMALYSVALIHKLSQKNIIRKANKELYDIIYRSGQFMKNLTRPDGEFTQIGDNDSGIFFRFSITGDMKGEREYFNQYSSLEKGQSIGITSYLDEDMNDGRTYISAVSGMFEDKELEEESMYLYPFEHSLVDALMKGGMRQKADGIYSSFEVEQNTDATIPLRYEEQYVIEHEKGGLTSDIKHVSYPGFGVYIFRSENMYLCFNATDNGQKGNGGHAHNDKLSFELFIDGKPVFEDPGTYVYTPFPELRNLFRGTRYHNTIYCGTEQNRFNGLFSMKDDTRCTIISLEECSIEAEVRYRGIIHRRKIEILDDRIVVTDRCNHTFGQQFEKKKIARGYGKLER